MTVNDLCQRFLENHAADAARSLEGQPPAAAASLLSELPPEAIAPTFGCLDPMVALTILEALPVPAQAKVVGRLETNKATALLRRMNSEAQDRLFEQMPLEQRQPLVLLLGYPENTVGARMDPRYPCLPEDLSLAEALHRIQTGSDRTSMFWFTVDRGQVLTGVVSIRDLLSPDAEQKVVTVRQPCPHRLSALTDMTMIRSIIEFDRLNLLPVVDERNIYLGAVRQESVLDLNELDQPEDSLQIAGSALGELYRLGLFGLVYSLDPGTEKKTVVRGS